MGAATVYLQRFHWLTWSIDRMIGNLVCVCCLVSLHSDIAVKPGVDEQMGDPNCISAKGFMCA